MDLETQQNIADNLLTPLWRGLPDAYKMRYARNIWNQFEDAVRSSAYTSDLNRFVDTFCRKSGVEIGKEGTGTVAEFLRTADSRQTLKLLREETTVLVLLVRLENEKRKAEWKERKRENEELEELASGKLLL